MQRRTERCVAISSQTKIGGSHLFCTNADRCGPTFVHPPISVSSKVRIHQSVSHGNHQSARRSGPCVSIDVSIDLFRATLGLPRPCRAFFSNPHSTCGQELSALHGLECDLQHTPSGPLWAFHVNPGRLLANLSDDDVCAEKFREACLPFPYRPRYLGFE